MADRLPSGMIISGVSFHRGSPSIKRVFETFILPDAGARKLALLPFDYVAVCRYELPSTIPDDTVFVKLMRGDLWHGLEPIDTGEASGIRLYRINHLKLQ